MIRIGFIFPSSFYLFDPFRGDPHTHFQILTVLEERFGSKAELSLIDLRGINRDFAIYHIPECDIYMHSVYSLDYSEQVGLVKALRTRYPKAVHIAGGPHVAVFEKESMKIFDSLIFGDGEESIVKAVNDYSGGKLARSYVQEKPLDLNVYPFPRRKWLPESANAKPGIVSVGPEHKYEDLLSTTVIFSRGCPYNCSFCAMPKIKQYSPGIRYRKPELILEEIEYLKKTYGIKAISLLDELGIPPDPKKAMPHLEAIGKAGIVWKGQCRVDGITPDIAKAAKDSGCAIMCFGVESACQKPLDLINKKIDLKRTRESIRLIKKNGIECRLYMIIGLPGEPDNIVDLTWDFIKETDPDLVYLSLLTARPGTELYDNPEKFGIINLNKDWAKTMHMYGRYTDETPTLTFEYRKDAPWGKSRTKEQIVHDYLELQNRLKERGMAHR